MSQKISLFFLTKLKKKDTKNNFVLSCCFDPIKIRTRLAPQNVHKNLSFVKDTNVVCQNMTRKCCKIVQKPICALHFRYVFRLNSNQCCFQRYTTIFYKKSQKTSRLGGVEQRAMYLFQRQFGYGIFLKVCQNLTKD